MAATGYDDRILLVEAIGLHQRTHPSGHCTFQIPYRSLTRTLQFINRSGGKIVRVSSLTLSLPNEKPSPHSTRSEPVERAILVSDHNTLLEPLPPEIILDRPPTPTNGSEELLPSGVKIGSDTAASGASGLEAEAVSASPPVKSKVATLPQLSDLIRLLLKKLTRLTNGA